MILFHRITPFLIGLVSFGGFLGVLSFGFHPLMSFVVAWALAFFLLGRLALWQGRSMVFWNMVGVPALFLLSTFGLFLFLESSLQRWVLAVLASILVFLFTEHVFAYVHTPALYQAYAIEHLSRALNVIAMFSLGVVAFGSRIFLQTPFVLLVPILFFVSFFLVYGTLWASKIEAHEAVPYGFVGAVLLTEWFVVVSFLPTGIYTNAALLALALYFFLGFARAHFLNSLSRTVVVRYTVSAAVLLVGILGTAQWR